ncbi:hypothetical protein GN958_ATG18445 [Phytophthora infestans]|uniref:Uncharacterized protein n=1 Tax=Phytophthora infestans TaxID=4787 RepID=A0A8S9U2C7_PHYIN|nr:hypothetical protein GN958_ATG18445 [Phytophthora infestans]
MCWTEYWSYYITSSVEAAASVFFSAFTSSAGIYFSAGYSSYFASSSGLFLRLLRRWHLGQKFLDILLEGQREILRRVALVWLAVAVHQELGVVPLDVVTERARQLGLQVRKNWRSARAINVVLLQHQKHHVVRLNELQNLLVGAGLRASKFVSREAQPYEAFPLALLMQLLQLRVVRGRQAALTRHVDDQHHLPL